MKNIVHKYQEQPLCFAGMRGKFAVGGFRRAFREERGEFTVNSFIGQIIRDEENACVPAPECKRFEVFPIEGQDEAFLLVCKLVDIWISLPYMLPGRSY